MPASRLATPHRSQLNVMCPGAAGASLGNVVYGLPPRYGNEWFVDVNNGSDGNDGRSWEEAYTTIQKAVDMAESYDTIFVAPGGDYTESVVTRDVTHARPQSYMKLIGCAGLGQMVNQPWWTSDSDTEPCLKIQSVGMLVQGFKFIPPLSEFGVKVQMLISGTAGDIGIRANIIGNTFCDLSSTCLGGIDLNGAPWEVTVADNDFYFIQNAGGTARAITSTSSGHAIVYRSKFLRNTFWECDNCIDFGVSNRGINGSIFIGNAFQGDGFAAAQTTKLDLGHDVSGGANLVMGNYFGGTYSHAGGYWESGGVGGEDDWGGNFANLASGMTGGAGVDASHPG